MWRDDAAKKAWTTQPLKASWTMKNADAFEFDGYHSAVWEQQDAKWLIVYEHFWGSVKQTGWAPPPPPPPVPPPPPPEPEWEPKDIYFDYDKYDIRADQIDPINFNAEYLVRTPPSRSSSRGTATSAAPSGTTTGWATSAPRR